jgi:hydrogenase maturation protease
MRTLVLGMGNPILCDDAVGIRLCREVRTRFETASDSGPAGGSGAAQTIDFIEDCSLGGLNLLDLVIGYDRLVVFDSIRTPGETPGTWHAMTGATFRETMNTGCVHDANFTTALELGRQMGSQVPAPEETYIFAVEISDNTTFSESMTPELEAAFDEAASEIARETIALLLAPSTRLE